MRNGHTLERRVSIFLSLMMVCLLLPAWGVAGRVGFAYVNMPEKTDTLKLMKSPSTNAEILGEYYNGVIMEIVDYTGTWAKVCIGGDKGSVTGYFPTKYLAVNAAYASIPCAIDVVTVHTDPVTSQLPLYSTPSTNASIVTKFDYGTYVEILGRVGIWCHVRIGWATGYVIQGRLAPEELKSNLAYSFGVPAKKNSTIIGNGQAAIYSGCSTSSSVITYVDPGSAVEIVRDLGTWSQVYVGTGFPGFMQTERISTSSTPATPPAGSGNDIPESTAVVNNPNAKDRLFLRTAPKDNAPAVAKYYNGVQVEILSYNSSVWAKVRIGGTEGYMQKKYLAYGDAAMSVASAIPSVTVQCPNASERLNLRTMPDSSAQSIGKYYNRTVVEVLGIGDVWYHVRIDGKIGFVMAKFLSPIGPSKTTSPSTGSSSTAIVVNPKPTDRLHLRSEPKTTSYSLGKYYTGVEVKILSPEQSGWYKVQIGNRVGFMQSIYLNVNPQPNSVQSAIPTMVVNNPKAEDRLNLRELPSTKSASLGKYYNGTAVEILGLCGEWVHVRIDGIMGFMLLDHLK